MSNRKDNYPGPIPNRWLKCPIRSDSFIGEKFIAFKTPLDKKFDPQTGDAYSFYPNMLFDLVKNIYKVSKSLNMISQKIFFFYLHVQSVTFSLYLLLIL